MISLYSDDVITYNHRRRQVNKNDMIPVQVHDVWEIIFIKEGELDYIIEGMIYHAKENTLILTRPGYVHFLQFTKQCIYDRYDILFDAKILPSYFYKKISKNSHIITFEKPEIILKNFEKMDYYYNRFDDYFMNNTLQHLVEEIFYNITISESNIELEDENSYVRNEILIKAIEYIKENLKSNFTLDELCGHLYITKAYLHKLFNENLNISPKKYIISKRLAKAQQAIRHKKKPTEIYLEYGFTEYSTFYRNYKEFYGYSPSDELNIRKERKIIG